MFVYRLYVCIFTATLNPLVMDQEEKDKLLNMVAFWKAEKEEIYEHHEDLAFRIVALKREAEESGKRLTDIDRTLEYLRKKLRLSKPIVKTSMNLPIPPRIISLKEIVSPNAEQFRTFILEALAETPRFLHKKDIESYIQGKYKVAVNFTNLSQQLKNLKEAGMTVTIKYNNSNKYTFHGYAKWVDEKGVFPVVKDRYIFDDKYFPQLDMDTMQIITGPD